MKLKVSLRNCVCFIICLIFILQDTWIKILGITALNYIDEIAIILLFLYAFFVTLMKQKIDKNIRKDILLVITFWILGMVSCYLHSEFQFTRAVEASFLSTKFFIALLSVICIKFSQKTFISMIWGIKGVGYICFACGLFNFLMPNVFVGIVPTAYYSTRMGFPVIMSLFIHPGQFGWFMLLVAILYYAENKYRRKNTLWIFYVVMAVLSFRTKVIMSIILILLFENFVIDKKKVNWKTVVVLIIVGIITAILFRDILIDNYIIYFTASNGISARYSLMVNGILLMTQYFPIGVGFGKYASWYARLYYSEWYTKLGMNQVYGLSKLDGANFATDTFWPSIFGETGVLGSLCFIWILLRAYIKLKRRCYLSDANDKYFGVLGMFVFAQTLAESMGEAIFNSAPQNIFIALIIGCCISVRKGNK